MQPKARYLPPWLEYTRAPLASLCRSNPHQGIPSKSVTAPHVTQGTVRIYDTPRYGQGFEFMGGVEGVLFLADPTEFPQDTMVTHTPYSAATRLTRFPPFCQYKGLFVKAQSTTFFFDIIKALWFVHYSHFFHC